MKKIFFRRLSAAFAAAAVCFALFASPVSADDNPEADASGLLNAYVRVESGIPGGEATVLPRTRVTLPADEGNTVYDALLIAMNENVEASVSEYGVMISSIGGVSDENFQCFWMYAVNNKLAEVGADAYALSEGDEVVWYCVDWQEADYSYFTPASLIAGSGEEFTLTLRGVNFTEGETAVEGAMINIKPTGATSGILPMIAYHTDSEGSVKMFLPSPGSYEITAVKHNEDGVPVISRPVCYVTVLEQGDDGVDDVLGADEVTPFTWPLTAQFELNPPLGPNGKPFYEDGVLYVPVRAIAEEFKAEVLWDEATHTATIRHDLFSFSFCTKEYVGGRPVIIKEGRSFVPADYIAEQLGFGEVTIKTK